MSQKLTQKQKMEVVYRYAFSEECLSMGNLANEYGISKPTVSKLLHNSIENLDVSRSLANTIRDRAVFQVRVSGRSPRITIESFEKSLQIFEENLSIIKKKIEAISLLLNDLQAPQNPLVKELQKEYDKLNNIYNYLIK